MTTGSGGTVVIAGRLGAYPWEMGPLVAALTRGLMQRGHAVRLIVDSVEDNAAFAASTLEVFRPYEQTATAFPIRFPRWAARLATRARADRVISLTHRVSAPLWIPLDQRAREWLSFQASTRGPVALTATLARTPGAFFSTRGTVGATPQGPLSAPLISLLDPPRPGEREACRAAVRGQLGVSADQQLLLASAPEGVGRRFDDVFESLRTMEHSLLVIVARDTFTLQRRAQAIGGPAVVARLRLLTLTMDIRPLLLAADAALRGPGKLQRFAADAARLGTPLILTEDFGGNQANARPARSGPGSPTTYPHDTRSPLTIEQLLDGLLAPSGNVPATIARP